ncbi:MAG: hypothetical protein HOP23_11225 [Methylococcaceae bacterium]|nr:hypothetical protein [Methylococcaceae bacterium]
MSGPLVSGGNGFSGASKRLPKRVAHSQSGGSELRTLPRTLECLLPKAFGTLAMRLTASAHKLARLLYTMMTRVPSK